MREQARIQVEGLGQDHVLHELLPFEPGRGLALLPAPSPGDVFLDLEADPYVDEGGLEYLFGWVTADAAPAGTLALETGPPVYDQRWALDRAAECSGFEATVDRIMAQWEADPNMHVYHFGAYEPGALKRLMGRHATREAQIDRFMMKLKIGGPCGISLDRMLVRVDKSFKLEVHIDTDEGNACNLQAETPCELVK